MRTGWMRGMRRVGWRRVRFRGRVKKRRCSFLRILGVVFLVWRQVESMVRNECRI